MLPASNRGAGMNMGFPDVCLTPAPPSPAPIPIPYPNIAMNAMATPFSPVVKVSMVPALNMGSKIPMTSGDEGGVANPMFKQMGAYTMGNPCVFIDKLPGINLLCPTTGNNMNNPLGAVTVPSVVNVMYCRSGSEPGALDLGGIRALDAGMHDAPAVGGAALHPGGIATLTVARFTPDLPTRVHDALRRLEALGARALVLDLRANPGGDFDAAVRLASMFLPADSVIALVEDGDGDVVTVRTPPGVPSTIALVLLVDGGTASAAEVFAGCLQAEARALVVGAPTYGKTSVQRVITAPDGSARYATVARCVTHGTLRVEPDCLVASSADVAAPLATALDLARALCAEVPVA